MRITLNLDGDVLSLIRSYAQREKITLDDAVSQLARKCIQPQGAPIAKPSLLTGRFALMPMRDEIITTQHVRNLMDQEGM